MTQVPAGAVKVTVPLALIVQPEVEAESIVRLTGSPDVAVAPSVKVEPTRGDGGGVLEKEIVWVASAEVTDSWTWGAGA